MANNKLVVEQSPADGGDRALDEMGAVGSVSSRTVRAVFSLQDDHGEFMQCITFS